MKALFEHESRGRKGQTPGTALAILLLAAAAGGAGYLLLGTDVTRPDLWIAATIVVALLALVVVLFGVRADRKAEARRRAFKDELNEARSEACDLRRLTRELSAHGNRRRAPHGR